ncbi:tail fiber assembly protein [Kosakonia pseudosacchari]|nr:tail fiber assembly protein [Kosakonia pseudosacchari]
MIATRLCVSPASINLQACLAEWKKYRVLLMRVDTAAPQWPTPREQAS